MHVLYRAQKMLFSNKKFLQTEKEKLQKMQSMVKEETRILNINAYEERDNFAEYQIEKQLRADHEEKHTSQSTTEFSGDRGWHVQIDRTTDSP